MLFHVILIVYIFKSYYYYVCVDSIRNGFKYIINTGELASPAQIEL